MRGSGGGRGTGRAGGAGGAGEALALWGSSGLISNQADMILPVAWVTRDISKSGVIGDATTATKEKGDRILKSVANDWVQVIQDIYAYRQPKVEEGLTHFTQS